MKQDEVVRLGREIAPFLPKGWEYTGAGAAGWPVFKNGDNAFFIHSQYPLCNQGKLKATMQGLGVSVAFTATRSPKSIALDIGKRLLSDSTALQRQAENRQASKRVQENRDLLQAKEEAFKLLGFKTFYGRGLLNMHRDKISFNAWDSQAFDTVEIHNVTDEQLIQIMQIMEREPC
jgi:hypothetical protein